MCQLVRVIHALPSHTSVYLCTAPLQSLAVPQDLCSPLSVPLDDLAYLVFDGVGQAGFKSSANDFFNGLSGCIHTIVFYYFILSLSVYRLVLWGWGLRTDRVYITLSQPCTSDIF